MRSPLFQKGVCVQLLMPFGLGWGWMGPSRPRLESAGRWGGHSPKQPQRLCLPSVSHQSRIWEEGGAFSLSNLSLAWRLMGRNCWQCRFRTGKKMATLPSSSGRAL